MEKKSIAAVFVFCLVFAVNAFSQSSNGSLGGIVQDPSAALVPGVTITLTNTGTGIVNTTISNDTFGNIAAKGTQVRNFQGQLRLSF